MKASGSKTTYALGYLSFIAVQNVGIVGGYLLVDDRARPIEFHCTAPVSQNRTQQILYGETWPASLKAEHIGGALLKQASGSPRLLLTDDRDGALIRSRTDYPLGLFVGGEAGGTTTAEQWSFEFAGSTITTAPGFDCDRGPIRDALHATDMNVRLSEPLDRIRAAITEAQRSAA